MEKKRIALAGSRGGTGKTTLSVVLGTILRETYGKKVCFVDCDFYQHPISAQKQWEEDFIEKNKELAKEIFGAHGLDVSKRVAPPIINMQIGFEKEMMPEAIEKAYPECDVYIYDFKDSLDNEEALTYLTKMDCVILPTIADSVNIPSTFHWIEKMNAKLNKLKTNEKGGLEFSRLNSLFLLFNHFNDLTCDFSLKSWLEDEAKKANIVALENMVRYFSGVARDLSCMSKGNKDFFLSVYLQPSNPYMEETNIHQVAEEIFISAGIVDRKVVEPHVIQDATILHQTIVEDLKQQLDEIGMSGRHLSVPHLSAKYKEIWETYQRLCSMSADEIEKLFGRKPSDAV